MFRDGFLLKAERVKLTQWSDEDNRDEAVRWMRVADNIHAWGTQFDYLPTEVIFEKPQIYRAAKSKGDPNQLIGLAAISMAVVGLLVSRWSTLVIHSPTPAEWIGQIPKSTTGSAKDSPRAQRILSRLTPAELALVPNQHDAIDAIGLGLHVLDRLGVRHAFSNGR